MKTLVIGDIHGCHAEMLDLIDLAGLTEGDRIIALGDIVDRGPSSLSVVRFFQGNAVAKCILGNHEAKHIQIFHGTLNASASQEIARQQMNKEEYGDMIRYFESLPIFVELPEALLIHGLLEPGVALKEQQKNVLIGSMSGERFISQQYPKPWYEYDFGEKPVIAGHHDYSKKGLPTIVRDRIFLIDTGCCQGKNLTGLILPDFKIISVKSKKNYWSLAKQEYQRIKSRTILDEDTSSF